MKFLLCQATIINYHHHVARMWTSTPHGYDSWIFKDLQLSKIGAMNGKDKWSTQETTLNGRVTKIPEEGANINYYIYTTVTNTIYSILLASEHLSVHNNEDYRWYWHLATLEFLFALFETKKSCASAHLKDVGIRGLLWSTAIQLLQHFETEWTQRPQTFFQ